MAPSWPGPLVGCGHRGDGGPITKLKPGAAGHWGGCGHSEGSQGTHLKAENSRKEPEASAQSPLCLPGSGSSGLLKLIVPLSTPIRAVRKFG